MERKTSYNPDSKESLNDRRVFGGNSDGMINFTKMKYQWALNLWDTMEANTWFPKEANTVADKEPFQRLSDAERRMFDLALAQLIFNDSEQANNLMDNVNPYITDPIFNACLARQSYEESNHSKSYAVLVEDLSLNTEAIYDMHKTDSVLANKNKQIATMYAELANENPTELDIMKAMIANNILEGIVFFGGFIVASPVFFYGNIYIGHQKSE